MKKIAIVVHRYGKEIGSGAEYLAMQYANKLKKFYDIEVLTTTCLDYTTWENHFPEGITIIDDIKVIRFKTIQPRKIIDFDKYCQIQLEKINSNEPTESKNDDEWIKAQGPYCPDMITYISENQESYSAYVFITYLYYHTVYGLPLVANKSIFFPTAHDEPWIRQRVFKNLFCLPRYFGFLTNEEKQFVHDLFRNQFIKFDVIGAGITIIENANPAIFKQKYNIKEQYIVYVGRVDASKRCDEMISFFINYKNTYPSTLKLVLLGNSTMDIPKRDDITSTGFVDEATKYNCIAGADVMIAPSEYESFCFALLEGFALGIPGLVNGKCNVLRGHCDLSTGGLCYTNQQEFIDCLHKLITSPDNNKEMRNSTRKYINDNYTWERVTRKLCDAIEYVSEPFFLNHYANLEVEYMNRNIYEDEQLNATVLDSKEVVKPYFDDNNSIAVLLVTSNDYAIFLGVLIYSIVKNASLDRKYDIIILIDDITVKNMNLISSLIENYLNVSIRFLDVSNFSLNTENIMSNYSKYTYYRLFLPDVMKNFDKVLYLDSDVLVNADVSLLFDTDIEGFDLAATFDILISSWQSYPNEMRDYFRKLNLRKAGEYIQAGVILFNVKQINEKYNKLEFANKALLKKYTFHDQDFLNVFCRGKIKYISYEWNVFNLKNEVADLVNRYLPKELYDKCIEARKNPKIIHYPERQFPCYVPDTDFDYLYWEYARNTPFYENLINIMIKKR